MASNKYFITTSDSSAISFNESYGSLTNSLNSAISYGFSYNRVPAFVECNSGEALANLLIRNTTEETLMEILDTAISREKDNNNFNEIISFIVRRRHFSEYFLLKYSEFLSLESVQVLHNPELATNEYAKLALYFEVKK